MRINVGCGTTPIEGWENFDNSVSIKFFNFIWLAKILSIFGLINRPQMEFILTGKSKKIKWADAKKLPVSDNSVEIIYSSHMLEHLDRVDAKSFIAEAHRVLMVGGVIRLCMPDLKRMIEEYLEHEDADAFVEKTLMCVARPRSIGERLAMAIIGPRHHQWMYDAKSLTKLLESNGFAGCQTLKAGESNTTKSSGVDLYQHADHSFYLEAVKI
jgi:predicted SAM-dependent methyltransferase